MIQINVRNYEGFIFDLDGTLADSMPFHFRAWKQTLEKMAGTSAPFTEEVCYQNAGRAAHDILEELNHAHGWNLELHEFEREKEEFFAGYLPQIKPIEPVVDLVKKLSKNNDSRIAVASGGLHRHVKQILQHLELESYFRVVVGTDHVSEGKPAPDIFLRAAELLEINPKRCLVFEDAPSGFAAAKAAGMDCMDVRPFYASGIKSSAKLAVA